jgi:hypothetical protein
MRARFINENMGFTEDGDPIKDMGIGAKIVNFQSAYDSIKPSQNMPKWLRFIENFQGKTIKGTFKNENLNVIRSEFKILECISILRGSEIRMEDTQHNHYYIIKSENYFVYR